MGKIYASKTNEIEKRELDHKALSRRFAGECVVLLENKGVLPLKDTKAVALYGSGARMTIKGGTGSGDVNTRDNVNIEQGFKNAGFSIASEKYLDKLDAYVKKVKDEYLKWTEEEAKKRKTIPFMVMFDDPFKSPAPLEITEEDVSKETDTAVYVISRNSGEGADRFNDKGDYLPYDEELAQIEILTKYYSKVIVILNIGGVMEVGSIKNIAGVGAIVLMAQLGNIGGDAICDVLTGKVTPSGKTTDTWAVKYMDYPSSAKFSHNESVHDEMYEDGIFMGYRYFDSFGVKPEYSFGYGLSYTTFEINTTDVKVSGEQVLVDVNVKNTGADFRGKEVVQIYVSAPAKGLAKPYQSLVAYAKTKELAPNESQTLTLTFKVADMASYDESKVAWVLEAGDYVVRVGNSADNTNIVAVLKLDKEIKTRIAKNLFKLDVNLKEISPKQSEIATRIAEEIKQTDNVKNIDISTLDIKAETISYQGERKECTTDKTQVLTLDDVKAGKCSLEEMVAQLSVEEMAELAVGTLRSEQGELVGNASYIVPGAAGDTSSVIYKSRNARNLIMADGPAGIRLQPHFKTTKDGKLIPGGTVLGDSFVPFDTTLSDDEIDDYYQYCTAIPIGWALAQSWNTAVLEEAGDMIGKEMEQFGVDLWLAPALNIHRNPLCGRNFEYYSEDPVISGKTAAAITKGVQKHAGKAVTIKHFAVNNQEDNRYFVNAHVSERALREIYLKGFEITVKESNPVSVMTSYNLLNGIHTANSHDLIQGMLRDEWGYDGAVMTDWFTSQDTPGMTGKYKAQYPISASTGCIYAGNDIQMPGCKKNVDDIIEAVNSGKELDGYKITKADLQYCAANIIRMIIKCL